MIEQYTRRGLIAAQVGRGDAEAGGHSRAEVLEQHVGVRGEVVGHTPTGLGLQVEHHAAAVAVQREPELGDRDRGIDAESGAGRVAGRRFDLDDGGTELPERAGGQRAREEGGEVEDPDPREREHESGG